jgi:hypothetical protein
MTFPEIQKALDRHVVQYMAEASGSFGPTETFWRIRRFTNEWITKEMARAILRSLTDRGFCEYRRGLFTEDGEVAGAGYGLTRQGLVYYEQLMAEDDGDIGD